ncbi:Peroxiredoxin [Bernardetia litoralis DSM 6794]|uniref:Peroxiredoxin n=1 Tax=Bernardetia litoralis (strain ATCC 23117 / DSM 6794 / NBRC 15988 / NCIMB 1366 / Fx l1 / Sio-4) TaxID=880071 RepID=I4APW9_BERLS|nr:TlpA disulfide reductase family protein [Bernardetia litoralis]AFM06004.1 Peroxiredoxin [Bernardetia litoralis DSM 6794]
MTKSIPIYFSFIILIFSAILFSCNPTKETSMKLPNGIWRATLQQQEGAVLPFNFEVNYPNESDTIPTFTLINGEEKILLDDVSKKGNTFTIPMHIFEGEIIAEWNETNQKLTGKWNRRSFTNASSLDFSATPNTKTRFEVNQKPKFDLSGKWETYFLSQGDSSTALGVFEKIETSDVKGNLKGTFLTTTGDYRYLFGSVSNDSLYLSCFDGSHAFLFVATAENENTLKGKFWSGKGQPVDFISTRNPDFALPKADTLTYLKEGYETIAFEFPNLDGKLISLENPDYDGKVKIIQLLGSWCPNCMDETNFLTELYKTYNPKGLEIIGLAYEQTEDFDDAKVRLERMKKRLNVDYEILFAGRSDKNFAAETLPMLNHVMSFPTTIFIDKKGKVRKIHTGFSGKGTGEYYDNYVEKTTNFVEMLLSE